MSDENLRFAQLRARAARKILPNYIMAKSQNTKKQTKKTPLKTAAEKKVAKRDKKSAR
jgi:hypothetical protein